jgi:hypothetical protein
MIPAGGSNSTRTWVVLVKRHCIQWDRWGGYQPARAATGSREDTKNSQTTTLLERCLRTAKREVGLVDALALETS